MIFAVWSMRRELKKLTIRKKQAFGAICLAIYCRSKSIHHPSIDELIEHLLSLLVVDNVSDWGEALKALDLHGLGDPIPESLEAVLDPETRGEFHQLVESTVEIGCIDLYVATSHLPLDYALECVEVLRSNGIELPRLEETFLEPVDFPKGDEDIIRRGSDNEVWGDRVSEQEYAHVMAAYLRLCQGV